MEDPIASVGRRVRIKGSRREQVMKELNSHMEASRLDLELSGRTPDDAARESIRRFGDPAEVAELLTEVHRRRLPRVQSLAVAMLGLVALSAWLGTSHTFASSRNAPTHVVARTYCRHRHAMPVRLNPQWKCAREAAGRP